MKLPQLMEKPLPPTLEFPTDPEDPVSLYGSVQSAQEAVDLFDRAHCGTVRVLRQHLTAEDKDRIAPGHVFIFDATRIERWTDNRTWSKAYSTKAGWLIYNEAEYVSQGGARGAEGAKVRRRKAGGMSKKIIIDKNCPASSLRLVCYFARPASAASEGEVPEAAACVHAAPSSGGESPYAPTPTSPRSGSDSLPATPRDGSVKRTRSFASDGGGEYEVARNEDASQLAQGVYFKRPMLDTRYATLSHAPRAHGAGPAPNDLLVPDAYPMRQLSGRDTLLAAYDTMLSYPKLTKYPQPGSGMAGTILDVDDELRMQYAALVEDDGQPSDAREYAGMSAFVEDASLHPAFAI